METGIEKGVREEKYKEEQKTLRSFEGSYTRVFLRYMQILKKYTWSHQVMEETLPQLDISHHQVKPPVQGVGCLSLSH